MADVSTPSARDHEFEEVAEQTERPTLHIEVTDLKSVKVAITADLGRCSLLVRDVLELKEGSVIQLDKLAGEMTDIYVNGLPLARGEVVVIGDALHVRVGEILGQSEKPEDIKAAELEQEDEEDEI
ncbi:MAG: FliM/FliN family flagellar motor switch protein [Candidatus Hydrogenedentes bacterium]|nr:FliM/FliN family flagellar motor switch protein [Candidatus Hydrogenedentota bacterium]